MFEDGLPEVLSRLKASPDFKTSFTPGWTQGRAAFGGLAGALASCGMARLLQTPQTIRSMMVSFVAPLPPAEVTVVPRIVRQGKNVTQLSADVLSGDTVCLQAMGVFGNSRPTLRVTPNPLFRPEPREGNTATGLATKRLPPFLNFFEGSWTGGGQPFSGSKENRLGIWIKHKSDMSEFPVERILSLADIPPPVIMSHYSTPTVLGSSLTWSLEFIVAPETIKSDWFYLDFEINNAADGYTQQSGKVFTEDGQLCALSRQCMVYFEKG